MQTAKCKIPTTRKWLVRHFSLCTRHSSLCTQSVGTKSAQKNNAFGDNDARRKTTKPVKPPWRKNTRTTCRRFAKTCRPSSHPASPIAINVPRKGRSRSLGSTDKMLWKTRVRAWKRSCGLLPDQQRHLVGQLHFIRLLPDVAGIIPLSGARRTL